MQIFTNERELSAAFELHEGAPGSFRFKAEYMPAGFQCDECGAVRTFPMDGIGTGYARNPARNGHGLICYACAARREAESMHDRSKPFYAYLSSDGRHVTGWTGNVLGDVTQYATARNGFHGSEIAYFRVRDIHGKEWSGRGAGRGICCTLRPMKG